MRWIFVSLVLINLLYFGWGYWSQIQETSVTSPDLAPQAHTPLEGQPLVLLTERLPAPASPAPPPTIAPERARIEPPRMPEVMSEPASKICARIGPYDEEGITRQLISQLKAAGLDAQLAHTQDAVSNQYWVLLPPAESRRRALQTLRELQARKIDSYLISSGEMKNAISLGLFSRDELARGVQERIREAGYPAEIRQKEKLEKAFWVQLVAEQPFENARKVLDSLISDNEGVKITNTPCEMFAQSN